MKGTHLGEFEELVLLTVAILNGNAYGISLALGQSIKVKVYDGDQEFPMKVIAVVEDPSPYTPIQFRVLVSMANAENIYSKINTTSHL